jgi:hypothetical protein
VPLDRPGTRLASWLYESTLPRPVRQVARALSWRLRRMSRPGVLTSDPAGEASGEVVAYFGEDVSRVYQLEQWVPVLEQLAADHPVVVVTRLEDTYRWVVRKTSLRAALVPTFRDLAQLYDRIDPKLGLYVNNGAQNFQSLSYTRMLHVHINHGESDKVSMVSNQGKAYDRVFVAGQAAVLRHRAALLEMDESKLVPIGRPQLDLELPPVLPASERRTILYAPTWEGESEANNYTSLDVYGAAIVAAALAVPDTRVVYKPHPRILTSRKPEVAAAHAAVVGLLEDAARRDPSAGHTLSGNSTNVLALLRQADLLVSDVSSVTLDYLYLRNDRPLLLTDRRTDRDQLRVEAPVSTACEVIDASTVDRAQELIAVALERDDRRDERDQLRRLYFGDLQHGQSTRRFLAEVDALIRLRDQGLAERGSLASVHRGDEHMHEEMSRDEMSMEESA